MSQEKSAVTSRTLIAYVEDRPAVLARVVSLLRRRGYSIDSLNVGPTEREGLSQVTLVVRIDEDGARRLTANLFKLVEVIDVEDVTFSSAMVRELALFRMRNGPDVITAVRSLPKSCSVRTIEERGPSFTLEVTGTRAEIDSAVETLRPFGILRLVRTGSVAVSEAEERREALREAEADAVPPIKRAAGGVA
jgi:acetolactate synthase-1/3 small subunit